MASHARFSDGHKPRLVAFAMTRMNAVIKVEETPAAHSPTRRRAGRWRRGVRHRASRSACGAASLIPSSRRSTCSSFIVSGR